MIDNAAPVANLVETATFRADVPRLKFRHTSVFASLGRNQNDCLCCFAHAGKILRTTLRKMLKNRNVPIKETKTKSSPRSRSPVESTPTRRTPRSRQPPLMTKVTVQNSTVISLVNGLSSSSWKKT